MKRSAVLYFDFISPFAYLLFKQLDKLPQDLTIEFKPVLFAGLLKHWEHKGPAEIPEKRKFTYRFVQWKAEELGIPLKFPPAHPFNPVKLLRLAVAQDSRDATHKIFDFVWKDGGDATDPNALGELAKKLSIENMDSLVENPSVKEKLIQNGKDALAQGVFGVPTFVVDSELFWGSDSLEMFVAYLENPAIFKTTEMERLAGLPAAAVRPDSPVK